jgi:SIR2-like protein
MLRTDIIRLINSGEAWVFVGAGASVDAGLPTWKGLAEGVTARVGAAHPGLAADKDVVRLIQSRDYPRAFARIAELTDRPTLVSTIRSVLARARPGELTKLLAQWPVRGYVTTNYEHLIQAALREAGHWGGWVEVGNSREEIAKAGGNARNIVWHVHGSVDRDERRFRPIITDSDYADLYVPGSAFVQQLKAFLAQQRLLFVGFGFQDPDLLKLLEIVKGFSSPVNPVYAFLGDYDHTLTERKRRDLFEQYNVDVLPYKIRSDGSHESLAQLLRVYGSFILKRSQKYGMPQRPCPSYAPETTAILLHNALCSTGFRCRMR